tara:strand:+ start:348 stop:674 length:327 start_codon:yes stop_codon:yes gene_type:complete
MYKIRGKIINVEDLNINTQKGDFLKKLITIEETETGFDHKQQLEIFGEESIKRIEHSKKLATGQIVNIDFYIKSREYNGKFYNTLMIKECRFEDAATIENVASKMPFE